MLLKWDIYLQFPDNPIGDHIAETKSQLCPVIVVEMASLSYVMTVCQYHLSLIRLHKNLTALQIASKWDAKSTKLSNKIRFNANTVEPSCHMFAI